MTGRPSRVLYVDDDEDLRELVAETFRRELGDVTVETAPSADEAEAAIADEDPDRPIESVVTDYEMPGRDGLDLLRAVRERRPDLPVILFTGRGSEEIASEAISAGVTDYIQKRGSNCYELLANRVRDAVDKHRTERTLRAEQRLFRSVLETNPNGVLLADADDGEIVYANERAREILRLDRERTDRRPSADGVVGGRRRYPHPDWERVDGGGHASDEHATDGTAYELALETGGPVYGVRHAIELPDGERRPVDVDAVPVYAGDRPEFVVLTVVDLTERERRRTRAEQYELLVENSADAMAVLDGGRYRFVNDAAAALADRPREAIVGATDRDLFPAAMAEALRGHSERALETRQPTEHRLEAEIDGETRVFEVVHVPHEGGPGDAGVVARVYREVPDRAVRERLLREERDRLESLAGTVAHDARNAIQLIDGRTQLAKEALAGEFPEAFAHLEAVDKGVSRLRELVASLESLRGVSDPVCNPEPVSVGTAAREAWATVDAPDASLAVAADPTVEGDPKRIRTLLENLLRNAVDHGGPGVAVTVDRLPDTTGFAVADDGPGIPEAERERVLEFGHSGGGGTGFGLGIVAGIAEAHGWSVRVTDSESGGARFEFRPETIDTFVS